MAIYVNFWRTGRKRVMSNIKDSEKIGKWVWNGKKYGFGFFKANFV